ncbi:MAG: hypothetical protein N4A72_22065 [Bacteroidales bacterium]|jgi:hypothetical protein|nr:hypothetical protein [Bacteroidales bacterium]
MKNKELKKLSHNHWVFKTKRISFACLLLLTIVSCSNNNNNYAEKKSASVFPLETDNDSVVKVKLNNILSTCRTDSWDGHHLWLYNKKEPNRLKNMVGAKEQFIRANVKVANAGYLFIGDDRYGIECKLLDNIDFSKFKEGADIIICGKFENIKGAAKLYDVRFIDTLLIKKEIKRLTF